MQRRRSVVIDTSEAVVVLPSLEQPVPVPEKSTEVSWQDVFRQAMATVMDATSQPIQLIFRKDGTVVKMNAASMADISIQQRDFPGMVVPTLESTATKAMRDRMGGSDYPTLAQQKQMK